MPTPILNNLIYYIKAEDLPITSEMSSNGYFIYSDGNEIRRVSASKLVGDILQATFEVITPSTNVPSVGVFRFRVLEPDTFNNVSPSITVSQNEIDNNWVYIVVENGVARKELESKPDDSSKIKDWSSTESLSYPSVRVYNGVVYRVKEGQDVTGSDVPNNSSKWGVLIQDTNELRLSVLQSILDIGDLSQLDTDDASSLVNAINELKEDFDFIQNTNANLLDSNEKIKEKYINYQRLDSLEESIFDVDGYFESDKIKPLSIETQMLSVGARSQRLNLENVIFTPNYLNQVSRIHISAGRLVHFTIDPDEPRIWNLSELVKTGLNNTSTYYIYAKCSRTGNNGTFDVTTQQIRFDDVVGFYYFLIGLAYKPIDGVRLIDKTYGASFIQGNEITTGKIKSIDGGTYFDLDEGEIGGTIKFGGVKAEDYIDNEMSQAKQDAIDASNAYADAQAEFERIQAEAYADGIVDAEEARAIQDAKDRRDEAKAYAEQQDVILEGLLESYTDAEVLQAKQDAISASNAYADAQAEFERIQAEAYADGIVDAEEARAIQDAKDRRDEAKQYAEQQDAILEGVLENYTDDKIDDIEIGGRNYLNNTRFDGNIGDKTPYGWEAVNHGTNPIKDEIVESPWGTDGVQAYCADASNNARAYLRNVQNIPVKDWKNLTVSLMSTSDDIEIWWEFLDEFKDRIDFASNESLNSDGDVKYKVLIVPNNAHYFQLRRVGIGTGGNRTGKAIFQTIKVEKGNKYTDWTASNKDVESDIQTARQNAIDASNAYADAQAEFERIQAEAYADGIVDAEEARAIQDAKDRRDEAKLYAEQQDIILEGLMESYTDSEVLQAKQDAIDASNAYADAQAEFERIQAEAYADGIVDAEELRAIQDAKDRRDEAKQYAEQQDAILEGVLESYTDAEVLQAKQDALDAQTTANAVKEVTDWMNPTIVGGGGVVASGTMIVGNNAQGARAGVSGLGSSSDSVRFWAGKDFAGRATAPFAVYQDGTWKQHSANGNIVRRTGLVGGNYVDELYNSNGQVAKRTAIVNGKIVEQWYNDGVLMYEIGENGIYYVREIPESWTKTELMSAGTGTNPSPVYDMAQKLCNRNTYVEWRYSADVVSYRYDAGQNVYSESNKQYEGYKTTNLSKTSNIANGWYVIRSSMVPIMPNGDAILSAMRIIEGKVSTTQDIIVPLSSILPC